MGSSSVLLLFFLVDFLPRSLSVNMYVEEGIPLKLNCSAMAEARERLGKDANFKDVEVKWELVTIDGESTRKRRIYSYWVEVIHLEDGFHAESPDFDLRIESVDFWSKNPKLVSVEFYCHVFSDDLDGDLYNIFTLLQRKHPDKVVIVGAERDVDADEGRTHVGVATDALRLQNGTQIKVWCRVFGAAPSSKGVFKIVDRDSIETEPTKDGAISFERDEHSEFLSYEFIPNYRTQSNKSLICSAFNPDMSASSFSTTPFPLAVARLDILYPPSPPELSFSGAETYENDLWVPISGTVDVECSSNVAGNPVAVRTLSSKFLGDDAYSRAAKSIVKSYTFVSSQRKSFKFDCQVDADIRPRETSKTIKVAFGPTYLSIETIHDGSEGKSVLKAGREVIFICASLQSQPAAIIEWKLPEGRNCRISPPKRCYFTPQKGDFGRAVTCVASNPITEKTIEKKMVLNTLHYETSASCRTEKDEYGSEQVSCTVDRYPKVSVSELRKMVHVEYDPEETRPYVNESLTILGDAMDVHRADPLRYPHPANLFRFRYSFNFTRRALTTSKSDSSSKDFVSVEFDLNIDDRRRENKLASVKLVVRRKPDLICGREGCGKRVVKNLSPAEFEVHSSTSSSSSPNQVVNVTVFYAFFAVFIVLFLAILVGFFVKTTRRKRPTVVGSPRHLSRDDVGGFLDEGSQCSHPQHRRNWRYGAGGSIYSVHSGYSTHSPGHSPGQMSVISTPPRASTSNLPSVPSDFHHIYSNPHRNFAVIQFDRNLLRIKETIGQGEYGQVFRASALGVSEIGEWTDVAVKSVKADADKSAKDALLAEMSIMRLVEPHDNVVRLLGCCIDADPYYVILEYLPGGNLQDSLRRMGVSSQRAMPLNSANLVNYGYQVAVGMNHLANSTVVHRDLAARNILLSADGRNVKIADFGLARDVHGFGVYEQRSETRLPIRWMAPEFLFQGSSSSASDVWSFGVLLWEIATLGATPYGQLPSAAVMRSVKAGERLQRPSHCSPEFFSLVDKCWQELPEHRPDFASVSDGMRRFLDVEDAIDMKNFREDSYHKLSSSVIADVDEKF